MLNQTQIVSASQKHIWKLFAVYLRIWHMLFFLIDITVEIFGKLSNRVFEVLFFKKKNVNARMAVYILQKGTFFKYSRKSMKRTSYTYVSLLDFDVVEIHTLCRNPAMEN